MSTTRDTPPIRIPADVYAAARQLAERSGTTLPALVARAVIEHLQRAAPDLAESGLSVPRRGRPVARKAP